MFRYTKGKCRCFLIPQICLMKISLTNQPIIPLITRHPPKDYNKNCRITKINMPHRSSGSLLGSLITRNRIILPTCLKLSRMSLSSLTLVKSNNKRMKVSNTQSSPCSTYRNVEICLKRNKQSKKF